MLSSMCGGGAIAVLTVRNIPDEVHRALRVRAAEHGRSAEAEVREILSAALLPSHPLPPPPPPPSPPPPRGPAAGAAPPARARPRAPPGAGGPAGAGVRAGPRGGPPTLP